MKLAAMGLVLAVAGSSPQVVARIQTGASPGGAVSAFDAVWVANDGAGTLVRIDPGTNRVTRHIKLRPGLFSVTSGFGAVWAENYKRDSLTRVDPASGRTRSVRVGASPFDVLCAFGRVWVTSWEAGLLTEIAPRSLRIVRRIKIGPRPTGLRATAGAVWVGFGRGATSIARVDPATSRFRHVQVGERAPSWFVAGTRDLWLQAADNQLIRVDRRTRRVTARVVDSFEAGPGAFLALSAYDSMWVASYAGDDLWRFTP